MAPGTLDQLGEALPKAKILDCTNLLRLVRMVKTQEEVQRMTRTAELSEGAALQSLSLRAGTGASLAEMTQVYRQSIARDGAGA